MNELKFMPSYEEACKSIDHAHNLLDECKKKLTKENFSHYSIHIEQRRNLEPINSAGILGVCGFRQMSPDMTVIIIENSQNLGKEFMAEEGPWAHPTPEAFSALDKKLSDRTGSKGWKQFKAGDKAAWRERLQRPSLSGDYVRVQGEKVMEEPKEYMDFAYLRRNSKAGRKKKKLKRK